MMPADKPNDQNDELRKRRERLEALKSKRAGATDTEARSEGDVFSDAPDAKPFGGGTPGGPNIGGGGFGLMQQGGPKRARQRKMLMKIYNVLTQTPEDEHGQVPDTPFTESGVARLMELLRTRSSDPSQPGAKVAESVLRFVTPEEGEKATASGASVEKLQMIARRIEAFRGKGGGAVRRGGAF